MMSNERYSPYYRGPYPPRPKPPLPEETLKSAELQVERKLFVLTVKENPRGRFLRITEETTRTRNSIIVPESGLAEFAKVLAEMTSASEEMPESGNNGQEPLQ